jgi:predicted DNA binding CopG/RHH family protein
MMQYYELDKEEQAQLEDIESGKFKSVKNLQQIKQEAVRVAKNSLNKTMNINIRLSERDVYRLKAKAAKEGLPYQTLAASILHKSASR